MVDCGLQKTLIASPYHAILYISFYHGLCVFYAALTIQRLRYIIIARINFFVSLSGPFSTGSLLHGCCWHWLFGYTSAV